MPILLAVFAFGLMILAHELGHFLVARWVGVVVQGFAIGFGPPLVQFRRRETTYRINLFPFGGYVRLAGEDFEEEAGPGSFRSKRVGQRTLVIAAGPLMNFLLAVLLLGLVVSAWGLPVGVTNEITEIRPGWPAERVGLRVGDRIVAINGEEIRSGEQMVQTIHQSPGRPLRIRVDREGRVFEVTVTPQLEPRLRVGAIGITPGVLRQRRSPPSALVWATAQTVRFVRDIVVGIVHLLATGRFVEELAGPVGAVRLLGDAARTGFDSYLFMTAFLSVMVGFFNLLPVPALDGGRLAFLLVEAVRRRAVDPRREGYVHLVGFALLLLLILVLTYRDILRWAGGAGF
ncbi:MAG: RIP metalloprotease RseP [Armatimonadota bacterium]|nr:RIP metalloprotease RseP [Armatimonadota bacterium]MDR7563567.1 RIP metalloprotease RseP [Armatimonadota bacterium]MDR7567726.1 RIP metalloprotease RseP [Armatimonadota bacterium]MDR7601066.1 RIP metalloprotease RseP [Armatimonadota bacterium]